MKEKKVKGEVVKPEMGLVIDGQAEIVNVLPVEKANEIDDAQRLTAAYEKACRGLLDIIYCGAVFIDYKKKVKKGQFGRWIAENCPKVKWHLANEWMRVAEAAYCLASGKTSIGQIVDDLQFVNMPIYNILQFPISQLNKNQAELRGKLFELAEGNSAKQLVFDFRSLTGRGGDHTPRDPKTGKRIQAAWGSSKAADPALAEQSVVVITNTINLFLYREGKELGISSEALVDLKAADPRKVDDLADALVSLSGLIKEARK